MSAELPKLPEPVAWLYTAKNYPDVQILDHTRWSAETAANYIEQPLIPASFAQEAARQAMERCDHLQLLFNASKLGHEQAFASSQRAHSALSALQRDLNIMLASAVPEGGEWVEGYRIKTGALHRIIGTMQEAGYSVVLPTLPPPPASVNGEGEKQ